MRVSAWEISRRGSGAKGEGEVWDMPRGGTIDGRKYSERAMEKMVLDTPAVRAKFHTRAMERA